MKYLTLTIVASFLNIYNANATPCTNFSGHWVGSCVYNTTPPLTKRYESLLDQKRCDWIGHTGSAQYYPIGNTLTQSYTWSEESGKYFVSNTYEYSWNDKKTALTAKIINTSKHENESTKVWNFKEELELDSGKLKKTFYEEVGGKLQWFYKCTAEIKN